MMNQFQKTVMMGWRDSMSPSNAAVGGDSMV